MKKIAILSLLVSSVAFAAQTTPATTTAATTTTTTTTTAAPAKAHAYSTLEGNWTGKITKNFKMDAGGKPTLGAAGADAKINLASTADGLSGTSVTAGDSEDWTIKGDTYSWSDKDMTVSAKAAKSLPVWATAELAGYKGGKTYAFQFDSCTIKATGKACEVKKDIPEGLDKGLWVFNVNDKKLTTVVLYQYPNGKVRHLSEELTK